jgi:hypothetical protein
MFHSNARRHLSMAEYVVKVRVAESCVDVLYKNLLSLRRFQFEFFKTQRFVIFPQHCRFDLHIRLLTQPIVTDPMAHRYLPASFDPAS